METALILIVLLLVHQRIVLSWTCIPILEKELVEGVVWRRQNCSVTDTKPELVINSIHVDVTRDDLIVEPAVASVEQGGVTPLPNMADSTSSIAGINGGYFWRVDIDGFWRDNVCHGKVRKEAEQNANPLFPNFGISDGVIKINGEVFGSNCNCTGYNRPAVLNLESKTSATSIAVMSKGEQPDKNVNSAIGAGPNLVSFNKETRESYVDIPQDDENINRVVYEAATAVGIVHDTSSGDMIAKEIIMVTSDGDDKCRPTERYCGLEAHNLATLMIDVFSVTQAMSMDQGGSTTMWVNGENPSRNGIVSRSSNKEPEDQEGTGRALANGLFVKKKSELL